MPWFNEKHMPDARNEYVCWVDIMGTKNKMENSVRTCAVFIFKLHSAILECSLNKDIIIYPVMDGAYITSTSKKKWSLF